MSWRQVEHDDGIQDQALFESTGQLQSVWGKFGRPIAGLQTLHDGSRAGLGLSEQGQGTSQMRFQSWEKLSIRQEACQRQGWVAGMHSIKFRKKADRLFAEE